MPFLFDRLRDSLKAWAFGYVILIHAAAITKLAKIVRALAAGSARRFRFPCRLSVARTRANGAVRRAK